jgi:hypothetical protein
MRGYLGKFRSVLERRHIEKMLPRPLLTSLW